MRKTILIMFLILLSGCGQGATELIGGYRHHDLGGENAISDRSDNMVVDPNVDRYKVIDPYIVGERIQPSFDPAPWNKELLSKRPGFFILDTRSGQLIEGMNESEFEKELRARNLDPRPFDWKWW
jgi:hypothetical protein